MPYYKTSQEWLTQSQLLLHARPTTTRITTKYTIAHPPPAAAADSTSTPATTESTRPPPPRAALTLKTYDSKTGVTLKYKTTKAAEVGRLMAAVGRMGRTMAGLPEGKEDVTMGEGEGVVAAVTGAVEGAVEGAVVGAIEQAKAAVPAVPAAKTGGAKKGKKKGKK